MTRAPEASLPWLKQGSLHLTCIKENKLEIARQTITHLSSILTTFSFSSWNDTTLGEGIFPDVGWVILLLVPVDKVLSEGPLLESCSPLRSVVIDISVVRLLDCSHDDIFIVSGVHLLELSKLTNSLTVPSFSETLQNILPAVIISANAV